MHVYGTLFNLFYFDFLYRYIAAEQVPVQYGGLSRDGDQEFTASDPVTEVTVKPASKHTVEIPVSEVQIFVSKYEQTDIFN